MTLDLPAHVASSSGRELPGNAPLRAASQWKASRTRRRCLNVLRLVTHRGGIPSFGQSPDGAAEPALLCSLGDPPWLTGRDVRTPHGAPQQAPEASARPLPQLPAGRQGQAGLPSSDTGRVQEKCPDPPDGCHDYRVPVPAWAEAAGATQRRPHQADGCLRQDGTGGKMSREFCFLERVSCPFLMEWSFLLAAGF